MHKAGILAWALVSAGLMAIGAFGPWMTALSVISLSGWDVQRRKAEVLLAIALLGALAVFVRRGTSSGGTWAVIAGLAGAALTGYEHHRITSAIGSVPPQYQTLAHTLIHVGWGLDAAIAGSLSLALSGLVSFFVAPDSRAVAAEAPARYEPNVPTVPAGWYRDPNDDAMLRYWNGFGWTTQTARPAS
jgi:Protein of unknown function (DUF2510)